MKADLCKKTNLSKHEVVLKIDDLRSQFPKLPIYDKCLVSSATKPIGRYRIISTVTKIGKDILDSHENLVPLSYKILEGQVLSFPLPIATRPQLLKYVRSKVLQSFILHVADILI